MNNEVGSAEIGQWYARSDKGEMFQVTGLDAHNGTIEIQTFDGDVDEIDEEAWSALPLTRAQSHRRIGLDRWTLTKKTLSRTRK